MNEQPRMAGVDAALHLGTEAGGVTLQFFRVGDRYHHRLRAGVKERSEVDGADLLSSCEGTSEQVWPPSPPLQQLAIEKRGALQEVALLLGMAGRSHWSLSVEADRALQQIAFSAACRCNEVGDQLASSYELHIPAHSAISASDSGALAYCVTIPLASGQRLRLGSRATGPGAARFERQGERLMIVPTQLDTQQHKDGFRTICWQYVMALEKI